MKRRRILLASISAVVATMFAMLIPGAAQAAAEYKIQTPSQWWCPYEAVCFYSQYDGLGQVCYSYGDVMASTCGTARSYYNNGAPCYDCDHVYVNTASNWGNGVVVCLHYGWTEGRGNFGFQYGYPIGSYIWGGEC